MKSMPSAIFPGVASALALALLAGIHPLDAFPAGAGQPAIPAEFSKAPDKDAKGSAESIVKEAMASHRIPSLAVAVVQNGKTVLQKAYGHDPFYTFADNSPSNGYALGPATQVLTGGAILLLVGEGKVGLDDRVSKYLPDLPEAWGPITIAQLLSHRSGLPMFPKQAKSFADAVQEAGKQPLRFKPGAQRAENAADFDLLGRVVEQVSGETYLKYMDHTVFKQMKFNDTGDFDKLMFRFVTPQDSSFSTTRSTQSMVVVHGEESASTLSGRNGFNPDPVAKAQMMELLYRGIPSYSIPSKGLASNLPDLLKLTSAIFQPSSTQVFNNPDYLTLAPGWKACNTGKDTLLTTAGGASEGYGINLSVVPSRKAAVLLLWKIESGSDNTLMNEESRDILESALGDRKSVV